MKEGKRRGGAAVPGCHLLPRFTTAQGAGGLGMQAGREWAEGKVGR